MSLRAAQRPGHRSTTRHAQAIYPFMAAGGLGGRGVFIGRDSSGGVLAYLLSGAGSAAVAAVSACVPHAGSAIRLRPQVLSGSQSSISGRTLGIST